MRRRYWPASAFGKNHSQTSARVLQARDAVGLCAVMTHKWQSHAPLIVFKLPPILPDHQLAFSVQRAHVRIPIDQVLTTQSELSASGFRSTMQGFAKLTREHEAMRELIRIKFAILLTLGPAISAQAGDLLEQLSAPPTPLVEAVADSVPPSSIQQISYEEGTKSCGASCERSAGCGCNVSGCGLLEKLGT